MKSEEVVKRELKAMIESNALTIAETKRIFGNKKDISDYEKGRAEGVILIGLDLNDNLNRFAERIGIKFAKPKEVGA